MSTKDKQINKNINRTKKKKKVMMQNNNVN